MSKQIKIIFILSIITIAALVFYREVQEKTKKTDQNPEDLSKNSSTEKNLLTNKNQNNFNDYQFNSATPSKSQESLKNNDKEKKQPSWLYSEKKDINYDDYLQFKQYLEDSNLWTQDFKDDLIYGRHKENFFPFITEALVKCRSKHCDEIIDTILDSMKDDSYHQALVLAISTEDKISKSHQEKIFNLCQEWIVGVKEDNNWSSSCMGLGRWSNNNSLDKDLFEEAKALVHRGIQEEDINKKLTSIAMSRYIQSQKLEKDLAQELDNKNYFVQHESRIALSFYPDQNILDLLQESLQKESFFTQKMLESLTERKVEVAKQSKDQIEDIWNKLKETDTKTAFIHWIGQSSKKSSSCYDFLLNLGKTQTNSKIVMALGHYLKAKDIYLGKTGVKF